MGTATTTLATTTTTTIKTTQCTQQQQQQNDNMQHIRNRNNIDQQQQQDQQQKHNNAQQQKQNHRRLQCCIQWCGTELCTSRVMAGTRGCSMMAQLKHLNPNEKASPCKITSTERRFIFFAICRWQCSCKLCINDASDVLGHWHMLQHLVAASGL